MNKTPPVIDTEVFWLRLEASVDTLRQQMMISPVPKRQVYYGMALGLLSAIRQAELISEEEFVRRSQEITDDLGEDG